MPYHLNIHFSAKSSETQTRLLLMHEDEGILNKVDEGLTEKLMAACNSADFTGKSLVGFCLFIRLTALS